MTILITSGTGTVGRATIAALAALETEAVAASRSPGAGGIVMDLRDPASVEAGARGFDAVLLITPLGRDETAIGVNAVAALKRAGVGKIVQLAIMNLELLAEVPHFGTKIPIKTAVLASGPAVVLEPNFFMQNDRLVIGAIMNGIYPLPTGSIGTWSVDADDVGRAAARALTMADWDGRAVPLCGPEKLSGPALAARWSTVIGRPVRYAGDAIAPFIAALEGAMPLDDYVREDLATMMRVTQAQGCPATPEQRAASEGLIGRPPGTHAAFARNLVARMGAPG